jgi:hypothetical protein
VKGWRGEKELMPTATGGVRDNLLPGLDFGGDFQGWLALISPIVENWTLI